MRTCVRMREEARKLREEGMSLRAIAARLGISLSTASVWTRDVALPARRAPPPESPCASDVDELRRCSRCGRDRPLAAFNRHGVGHQWWCRDCFRSYYAQGRAHHRARTNAL